MRMKGAEIVVETLIEQGVDVLFGYPGGYVIDIYNELYDKQDRITHVLAAHEQGACHAADGYARATGRVGVVLATSGPGATNLVTGIATAMLDSVPLLAITGNVPTTILGRDSFQEVDITGVTLPITKHNFIVHHVDELADILREAMRIAISGRPGPVLVDIPKDVQNDYAEYVKCSSIKKPDMPKASDDDIRKAADMIIDSSRPYIYIGGGTVRAEAGDLIVELASKVDGVIGSSMMGLSEISSGEERFLGMHGMHGHYASSKAMAKADLIIGLGVRFSDRSTGDRRKFSTGARKIQIDADQAEIGKNIDVDLGLACDIKDFLTRLIDILPNKENDNWMRKIAKLKETEAELDQSDFMPREIIKSISELVDPNTIIATDVGQHQMWTAQYFDFKSRRQFISSGGLGTMGFGMGAAIGAAYGKGNRAVLITGDGSFGMNLNELATAVAHNVPLTIVILNNGVLGMVRQWQTLFYDRRYSNTNLELRKTNFALLGESFGAKGYSVSTIEEFKDCFEESLTFNGPTVIDFKIDKDLMVLPMLKPGGSYDKLILENKGENDE